MREYVLFVILIFIPIGLGLHYFLRREGLPKKDINIILALALFIIFSFPICMARLGIYFSLLIYLIIIVALTAYLLRLGNTSYLAMAFASLRGFRQRPDMAIKAEPDLGELSPQEATNLLLGSLEATARELLGPVPADNISGAFVAAVADPVTEVAERPVVPADENELPEDSVVEAAMVPGEEDETLERQSPQEVIADQAGENADPAESVLIPAAMPDEPPDAPEEIEVPATSAEEEIETMATETVVTALEEVGLETPPEENKAIIIGMAADIPEILDVTEGSREIPAEAEISVSPESAGTPAGDLEEPVSVSDGEADEILEPGEETSEEISAEPAAIEALEESGNPLEERALIVESEAAAAAEPLSITEESTENDEDILITAEPAEAADDESAEMTADITEIIEVVLEEQELAAEDLSDGISPEAEPIAEHTEEVPEVLIDENAVEPLATDDRTTGAEVSEDENASIPVDGDGVEYLAPEPILPEEELADAQPEAEETTDEPGQTSAVTVDENPVEIPFEELATQSVIESEVISEAPGEEPAEISLADLQPEAGEPPESTGPAVAIMVDDFPAEIPDEEPAAPLSIEPEVITEDLADGSAEAGDSKYAAELDTTEEGLISDEGLLIVLAEAAESETPSEPEAPPDFSADETEIPGIPAEPEGEPEALSDTEREVGPPGPSAEPLGYDDSDEQQEINRWIDQGFQHKTAGDLPAAIYAFVQAWNGVRDYELKYLITLELVELYKACGYYSYAEQALVNYLELGSHKSDIIYEINRQLDGIRFLNAELSRLGLSGAPWAQVPRWIRMALEDKLNQ